MNSDIAANDEPLPGYRLTERLGAGGYGEVWRAEAPGGLTKAIKLVFGTQHEKRAERELRALELIKQLRHPFLLSLERIEIVQGRLIIVTELAEGSVKDRFDACRREGLPGIPREELLRYLRDAADALDYMSDAHGLQHLDIKPENLLLLANHVKVADFGLVKDVKRSDCSIVGGMTPLYAAPEVFRGQPSRQSDQYALAILFQEMLTGCLPFVGGNAAELTLQHLNDEPELSSLSGDDRYVVSRAMSKDPSHRYFTCREFVEALFQATTEVVPNVVSGPPKSPPNPWARETGAKENKVTELFDDESPIDGGCGKSLLIDIPPFKAVNDLPPLALDTSRFQPSPTLILGIGGAAGRVMRQLRTKIHEQFDGQALPAVQMLLIDTDPTALAEATVGNGRGLAVEETLNVPLRRPQHYRDRWNQLLSWLSRRWLYNIPKSMRTEGLRPLGRLALVDHARQTCQRIRRALLQATSDEAIAASNVATCKEFRRDALRVYVVAAVSGGTGSGMVLDVAFAVRAVLARLQLPETNVLGILLHATGRDPRHCELARVNAFSWLTEFRHFHLPRNSYPGDASCGLPPHDEATAAFDHAYFVHLGEGMESAEFDQAAQSVAEYLHLDALTETQVALDACRRSENGIPTDHFEGATNLRSFGVYRRSASSSGMCDRVVAEVASRLLEMWRHVDDAAVLEPQDAPQLVRRLQLTSAGIATHAHSLFEARLGADTTTFLTKFLTDRLGGLAASEAEQFDAVDDVFNVGGAHGAGDGKQELLGHPVGEIVEPLSDKLRSDIRRWLVGQIDVPSERLSGAVRGVNWLKHHIQTLIVEAHNLRASANVTMRELRAAGKVSTASVEVGGSQRVANYFGLRLDHAVLGAVELVGRLILSDVKSLGDDMATFGRELAQMASTHKTAMSRAAGLDFKGASETDAGIFSGQLEVLAVQVDSRLQTEYLREQGGLFKTVMQGGRPRALLSAKLQELARHVVQQALSNCHMDIVGLSESNTELLAGLASATPDLLESGGAKRVLAIVSREAAQQINAIQLSKSLRTKLSLVPATVNGLTLCVEIEQLSLPHVALSLVERRRDSVEFAKRVHTRSDVPWTPLLAPVELPEASWLQNAAKAQLTADHAMRQTEVV